MSLKDHTDYVCFYLVGWGCKGLCIDAKLSRAATHFHANYG